MPGECEVLYVFRPANDQKYSEPSSAGDSESQEDRENRKLSGNLKRKSKGNGLPIPASRASPKRQKTERGSANVSALKAAQPYGSSRVSLPSSNPHRTSQPGPSRLPAVNNKKTDIPKGSIFRSIGLTSEFLANLPSLRKETSFPSKPSKLRDHPKGSGLPIAHSSSSSSNESKSVIDLTDSSDSDRRPSKRQPNSNDVQPPPTIPISNTHRASGNKSGKAPYIAPMDVIIIDDSDEELPQSRQTQRPPKASLRKRSGTSSKSTANEVLSSGSTRGSGGSEVVRDFNGKNAIAKSQRYPNSRSNIATDRMDMMDVEQLLREASLVQLPEAEQNYETTPDPMDVLDAPEAPQLRRSTRSRSTSGVPSEFVDGDLKDAYSSPSTSPPPPDDYSIIAPAKSFGGFQSLNWRTHRENIQPKCYFSRDLPHMLQDIINNFSEALRFHRSLKTVMEAAIRENTAEEEPDAPLIEIINEVDADPTPPWEFHYSNKMWLGDDVPLPDPSKLVHYVNRKDALVHGGSLNGWMAYGRLRVSCLTVKASYKVPIILYSSVMIYVDAVTSVAIEWAFRHLVADFVVQQGRKCAISIQKTPEKGWGVFAGKYKIPAGSFIGIYAGELLTDKVGEIRGITYNKFGRTYLFDLDFYHLKKKDDGEIDENWDIHYTVDAYHAGNFTRFLNHSCDPNCALVPCYINESDLQKPLLTVFAKRDIEPFEEICFSYSGEPDDNDEQPRSSSPAGGQDAVYVKCACKAKNCTGSFRFFLYGSTIAV
ncbi:hypothetical protein H0H93_013652 [Arthromyces matolae]|nr:hypothetical protein H0H93_013652 [Arthromyces matolae]